MRQIVLKQPGIFEERTAPPAVAGAGEALLRIRSVGVCGSDFHAFRGTQPVYTYPRVLGHEMSGEVVSVPQGESRIAVGQKCAIEPYIACGECRPCRLNRPNCCEKLRTLGIHIDGGMSGFLPVPADLLHPSEKLSYDQLALVETLGIGAHAVKRSQLAPREHALIVGAGPIGLAVLQFALAAGAKVSVLEKSATRREFARQFTDSVFDSTDQLVGDVVFDATGSARAMAESLALVAPAGRLVFVGLTPELVSLDDKLFHVREVTLLATRNSAHLFPTIIGMIEDGKIDTAPWINARLRLRDVPRDFAALTQRNDLVKAMIAIEDEDC